MRQSLRVLVSAILSLCVHSATSAPLTILAEQFNEVESALLHDGGVGIPEQGVVRTAVRVPLSGTHQIVVSAKVEEDKAPGNLVLRIDGVHQSRFAIQPSSTWQTYSIELSLSEGERVVALEYDASFSEGSPKEIQLHSILLLQEDRIPGLEAAGVSDFNRVLEYQKKSLLSESLRNIESSRKGPLVIQVVDQTGMPIADATVDIRLTRPAFVFGLNHCYEAFRENRSLDGHVAYKQKIQPLFSGGGVGKAMDWGVMNPDPNQTDSGTLKNMIAFNRSLGWQTQSAPLFKVPYDQWPDWVQDLDDEALLEAYRSRMELLINRSQGTIDPILLASDVLDSQDLGKVFEGRAVLGLFNMAGEVAPSHRFLITQPDVLRDGVRDAYMEIIETLLAHGSPLGGIGIELELRSPVDLVSIKQTLDQLALFNLPLYITRISYEGADSNRAAREFADAVALIYGHLAVKSIYFDAFWESCKKDGLLSWYTSTFDLTELGTVMVNVLTRQWNVPLRLVTGPEGLIDTYPEYGEITVSVQYKDGHRQEEVVEHQPGEAGVPTRVTMIREN